MTQMHLWEDELLRHLHSGIILYSGTCSLVILPKTWKSILYYTFNFSAAVCPKSTFNKFAITIFNLNVASSSLTGPMVIQECDVHCKLWTILFKSLGVQRK